MGHLELFEVACPPLSLATLRVLRTFFAAFPTTGLTASMKLLRNEVAIFVFLMNKDELQTKINENGRKGD